MLAFRITPGLQQLISFCTVHTAHIGEEQNPVVGGGHKEMLHHIIPTQLGAPNTLTAAMLAAVLVAAGALHIPAASNGNHHLLFGDQILHRHIPVKTAQDLGAALIAVPIHNLTQLFGNNLALTILRSNNRVVLSNQTHQLIVAVLNLLTFQSRQTTKLHIQNSLRLRLINIQQLH